MRERDRVYGETKDKSKGTFEGKIQDKGWVRVWERTWMRAKPPLRNERGVYRYIAPPTTRAPRFPCPLLTYSRTGVVPQGAMMPDVQARGPVEWVGTAVWVYPGRSFQREMVEMIFGGGQFWILRSIWYFKKKCFSRLRYTGVKNVRLVGRSYPAPQSRRFGLATVGLRPMLFFYVSMLGLLSYVWCVLALYDSSNEGLHILWIAH